MIIDESRSSDKREFNLEYFFENNNLLKYFKFLDYFWIFTNIVFLFVGLYFHEPIIIVLSLIYMIEMWLFLFVESNIRKFGFSFNQSGFPSFLICIYFLVLVGSVVFLMIGTWSHSVYVLYVSSAFLLYCIYKMLRLEIAEKGIT